MQDINRSIRTASLALAAIGSLVGCSSSTGPGSAGDCTPVLGGASGGHPTGVIDSIYPMAYRPFGVTVNSVGVVLIGKQDANNVARGSVANFTFPTSISAGMDPGTLAMAPNGATAIVSNFNDDDVGIIDIASNTETGALPVISNPYQVKFHPNGSKFYVGTATSGVKVFNAGALTLKTTIPASTTGNGLNGMAFSPSACKLYVSSLGNASVTEINTAGDTALRAIAVGPQPQEIAISKDSAELWVADETLGVQVYSLPTGTFVTTITGTVGAFGLAISPDGQQLYATLSNPGKIKIIDRAGRSVLTTLTVGMPRRVVFDATGAHAIVADELAGAILIK